VEKQIHGMGVSRHLDSHSINVSLTLPKWREGFALSISFDYLLDDSRASMNIQSYIPII
jgi:hypothetical protein